MSSRLRFEVERIHEAVVAGRRLGRHVELDPRSRNHEIARRASPLHSVDWALRGGVLDQGGLGQCTGAAAVHCLMTDPLYDAHHPLTVDDATEIYKRATTLDAIPGAYPPEDTGSSGLAAAKAAKDMHLIGCYKHSFSMSAMLEALQTGPVMMGIDWYDTFDRPEGLDARLQIRDGAEVRGGHEVAVTRYNHEGALVGGPNSWSVHWGDKGFWTMHLTTLRILLKARGDVVQMYR